MALAVLLSTLATLAHVALMAASGWFITAMALAGLAGASMNYFTPAAMIRAFAMIRTAARYGERIVGHEATLRFVAAFRPRMLAALARSAPGALDGARQGDLLTRLRGDVDQLEFAFLRIVSPLSAAALTLAVATPVLFMLSPAVGVVTLGLIAAGGVGVPALLDRASRPIAARRTARIAELDGLLIEALDGMAELAVYDPDGLRRARLLAASEATIADSRRLGTLSAAGNSALQFCAHAAMVAALAIGLQMVASGAMSPAAAPMTALLVVSLFDAVAGAPLAIQSLPALRASARRLFALEDLPDAVCEPVDPRPAPAHGDLVAERVSCTYSGAARPALVDVSLTVAPGRRVAAIGASGSGKSTLAQALIRLRPISGGTIRLGGVSFERLSGAAIRHRIVLSAQHDHLFAGTIRENLTLGAPGASEAQLREACAIAQILPFVEASPQGFDTFVGAQGAAVSGGEARRLTLARALLVPADIYILDEPTEGLDAETELRLLDAVAAARPQAGLLLLTHRPARLERMDEIVRLEEGRIIARGAPAEMDFHLSALTSWR